MSVHDLQTPALVIDLAALERNLATAAAALPGPRLRPHVKAHKMTRLAARQAAHGHLSFTAATPREIIGLAAAGLGDDLLLANETVDGARLSAMASCGARVAVAIDSVETADAAAKHGIREVLVDVNVGLPRCGCLPEDAGRIADHARRRGLTVRGVMGYEGHVVGVEDRAARERGARDAMAALSRAHDVVGGDVVSAGGTGTWDLHDSKTEVQAGSYALMDAAYTKLGLPFEQALFVWATVISVAPGFAVADAGLKCFGMDHGTPVVEGGSVLFCSDEHVTFVPSVTVRVGDRIRLVPAHVDPTVAYHERAFLVEDDRVVDAWPVDLRGW